MVLVEGARPDPQARPEARDPGSVEEIRETFGRQCWIQRDTRGAGIDRSPSAHRP
jgi:hypothetical protein